MSTDGTPVYIDVAPGGSATITLELEADFAGTYTGAATVYPNDPANPSFSFNLTGVVQAPLAQVTLARHRRRRSNGAGIGRRGRTI